MEEKNLKTEPRRPEQKPELVSQLVEFHKSDGLQVLFTICESAEEYLNAGMVGHVGEMEDIPQPGQMFFIAVSRRCLVYGPFRVTTEQYRLNDAVKFKRKHPGVNDVYDADCDYVFEFEPFTEIVGSCECNSQKSISWVDSSRIAAIPLAWWKGIRENRLDDNQLSALTEALLNLNRGKDIPAVTAIPFEVLGMSDEMWNDFLITESGGAKWNEDGSPANEVAFREFFGDSDFDICDANMTF